jgi:NAD(P)-dependent dehydrogenase (short-subunit alcohol dehydrogenase family)
LRILDRSERPLRNSRPVGSTAVTVAGDVRDFSAHQRAVDAMVARFGKLVVVIGNAAIWDFGVSLVDLPVEATERAFDEVFGINVRGCRRREEAAVPALVRSAATSSLPCRTRALPPRAAALYLGIEARGCRARSPARHELAPACE